MYAGTFATSKTAGGSVYKGTVRSEDEEVNNEKRYILVGEFFCGRVWTWAGLDVGEFGRWQVWTLASLDVGEFGRWRVWTSASLDMGEF